MTTNAVQVWTNPDAADKLTSLVGLSRDTLALASVPPADLERVAADLAAGRETSARAVPLSSLRRVEGLECASDLTVSFRTANDKTEEMTVTVTSPADRDALLEALAERLGPTWERRRRRAGRLRNLFGPLLTAVFAGLLTWVTYDDAQALAAGHKPAEIKGGRRRFVRLILREVAGWIGPIGVLIIGGLVLAGCALWFIGLVAYPAMKISLEPLALEGS